MSTRKNIHRGSSFTTFLRKEGIYEPPGTGGPVRPQRGGNGVRHDNRLCNLRWDTGSANNADKELHGTANKGERNACARLTDSYVRQIRSLSIEGVPQKAIAWLYGIDQGAVSNIVRRKSWKHIA